MSLPAERASDPRPACNGPIYPCGKTITKTAAARLSPARFSVTRPLMREVATPLRPTLGDASRKAANSIGQTDHRLEPKMPWPPIRIQGRDGPPPIVALDRHSHKGRARPIRGNTAASIVRNQSNGRHGGVSAMSNAFNGTVFG